MVYLSIFHLAYTMGLLLTYMLLIFKSITCISFDFLCIALKLRLETTFS